MSPPGDDGSSDDETVTGDRSSDGGGDSNRSSDHEIVENVTDWSETGDDRVGDVDSDATNEQSPDGPSREGELRKGSDEESRSNAGWDDSPVSKPVGSTADSTESIRSPKERRRESDRPNATDSADETEFGPKQFLYDVVSAVVAVLLVGLLLFAVSGVWPPLVAVESPSMDPHMKTGDLVFVMEEHRFPGETAHASTGVVTARNAGGYTKFQQSGDVIVYRPNGERDRTPIIHRAMFWVDKGEKWYDEANREFVGGADSCKELAHCPAKHAGFITKGDNNEVYDQVQSIEPVKPSWIVGTAELRVPGLGWVRLRSGQARPTTGTTNHTRTDYCTRLPVRSHPRAVDPGLSCNNPHQNQSAIQTGWLPVGTTGRHPI